jgi:predicted GNAT family acetyltransferase
MHPLDRPVWTSLTTYHVGLSEGNDQARRFARDINLFGSACDDSPVGLAALASLVGPEESLYLMQAPAIVVPPGLVVVKQDEAVQMIGKAGLRMDTAGGDILTLGDSDASEMLALAQLTKPGPFLGRTHKMGHFRGILIDGRLAAMAGERLRFPGYTEVSGVCTHPDFRGRGLARQLSAAVVAGVVSRGERPFLHAWKTNQAAITMYERLGFELRTHVNVAAVRRRI